MSRLRAPARKADKGEPTIALINVVFLLLVFFLVAGTLSAPRDAAVELADSTAFDPAALDPAAIYVDAGGQLRVMGEAVAAEEAIARVEAVATPEPGAPLTIVPDRTLDARDMLARLAALRAATDRPLTILTRRRTEAD
ncbi:biopolymer transporter ExbD [Acuticoccus yangtzensis]|uniref:biopolymer transporter ExbD n=1 Tax=Acuticoccus yangtzensis TaxID=1443441 RepID=UPI0009495909|nr:biopolymer transporter ExbD [Acuticoccus yangtzensis]